MQIARFRGADGQVGLGLVKDGQLEPLAKSLAFEKLSDILNAENPVAAIESLITRKSEPVSIASVQLLAPIDDQEVWAAGVTYRRSQVARMEESKDAASFYDKVYVAARPELFFKATPHRVSGHNTPLRIRQDAKWNVPEPELALVLNSRLELVGFTAGNDMSSRDIEGENPLYLPQAKMYNACCGLGPWITLRAAMPEPARIGIAMQVERGGQVAFEGKTSVSQMARTFDDLISWLGRDNSFPHGAFLLTGTGIVPGDDFTLAPGDTVSISIQGIGTLINTIVQG